MKVVRYGVFETNSSSTHSLTVCSATEYDMWRNGELYWNHGDFYEMPDNYKYYTDKQWADLLLEKGYYFSEYDDGDTIGYENSDAHIRDDKVYPTAEELFKAHKQKYIDSYLYDFEDLYSVEMYDDRAKDFEEFGESYSVGNVDIIVFGYYGYDG